jgi:hypothetical protein
LAIRILPLLASLHLVISPPVFCYEDGAPPGHTGGFGEPDCSLCHSDSEKNLPEGKLRVEGLPQGYSAGDRYELAVVLEHPDLQSGGFQLAVRSARGESVGELRPVSNRTQVVTEAGQSYLQHSEAGRTPVVNGVIRWIFHWTAPPPGTSENAPLYLHVAANAANDDVSALGDYVMTVEQVLKERPARTDTGGGNERACRRKILPGKSCYGSSPDASTVDVPTAGGSLFPLELSACTESRRNR